MINTLKIEVYKALEEVLDLELGVDIVNLGFVYEVNINEVKECEVVLIGPIIEGTTYSIKEVLLNRVMELRNIKVIMLQNPIWSRKNISRYGQLLLDL